jgi:hypothetical protein
VANFGGRVNHGEKFDITVSTKSAFFKHFILGEELETGGPNWMAPSFSATRTI